MHSFFTYVLFLLLTFATANENLCPSKCTCRKINQREELKLKCEKIANFDEIDLMNIANDIVQFNLSNNLLEAFSPKIQFRALQKLDLSDNKLQELHDNQFVELPNLRRLDLSNNNIKAIAVLAFSHLENLEKLRLNQNLISTITLGTFNPLISLKQLDISNNPLTCDCSLLWLLGWSQKESVKLVSNPTCNTPPSFKGLLLRKLKVGVDIHCKSPALDKGILIIDMKPDVNQVVFEGDTLVLQCTAPSISTSSKLEWTFLDSDPKLLFPNITVESHFLQSTGIITSTLRVPTLNRNHTGLWDCLLMSLQGNHSKGIMVVVISDDTEYCPITITSDNKGTYTWPRTVINYTATVFCEHINLNLDTSVQKASYFCSKDSQWVNLNTSMCSFTSETTKIFEQFSKVNSSIVESAKPFMNYTSNLKHFKDVMDVVFAVETMENYLKYLGVNQIKGVLLEVLDNLMGLPKGYLREAEYKFRTCGKLVNITEKVAGISSTAPLHKSNVAVETFPVKRHAFSNLKCTWYVDNDKVSEHLFYCIANSQNELTELPGKTIEASITVPETLFEQLEDQSVPLPDQIYSIFIAMYSSNKFFPVNVTKEGKDVVSAVAGVKLVGYTVTNLSDPIFITLRTSSEGPTLPVWWNPATTTWSNQGCQFSHEYQQHITFFCHNFGYYGLLQDITTPSNSTGAKFKLSHPAIYVGSFILFFSLLVVILTYLFCYQYIQMPKKAKHCLINLWTAICIVCFLYVFGVYQTEDVKVCEIVGMLLHYFTLSSLLWMCVGVNCMYKRLSKHDVLDLQDDELPSEQPIKKPIIGLYFVGWGVASIVCGISAAINIREYASEGYCFLRVGPPFSALYIPATILLLFLALFFMLIRCAIYSLDPNGHLSEGTQATENVDLDLLEPNFPESRSVISTSSKTASSEVEDQEHSPSAQLKAYVIFLCLYVLAWISCALATVENHGFIAYENDIFSIAYAIFSTVLSAFTVFFYCVARSDVRGQWILFSRKKQCFRTRNVSDTTENVAHTIQIQQVPQISNDLQVTSRSSSRSSHTKSNASALKPADLNYSEPQSGKINNVNLVILHRQQYRNSVTPNIIENPTNAAEVFYNPHQSIVARKFFKRQKRHMMKRNNLVPIRDALPPKDNSSVDQSIFGTSSKVNNANIHVERAFKKQTNPNIFSDSAEDYDGTDIQNIVDKLRKKDKKKRTNSIEKNMRSVSQQCTLEYSSENISDSILDTSMDKAVNSEPVPKIYVNPAHGVQSSVSVSDLDDLYQQIRRGPKENRSRSPCFSDSDVHRQTNSNLSDNVETTV